MRLTESPAWEKIAYFVNLDYCKLCSHKFSEGYLITTGEPYPENVRISGEVAFHIHDSHGIDKDLFQMMFNDALFDSTGHGVKIIE